MLGCSRESTLEVDGQEKVRTFMTTPLAVPLDFQVGSAPTTELTLPEVQRPTWRRDATPRRNTWRK